MAITSASEIIDGLVAVDGKGGGREQQKQRYALMEQFAARGQRERDAVVPRLIKLLDDRELDTVTRSWVPPFLTKVGDAARDALLERLPVEEDAYVRLWIVKELLRKFDGDDLVRAVIESYDREQRRSNRREIVRILAEKGRSVAKHKLTELLHGSEGNEIDDDPTIRRSAAEGLGKIADHTSAPELVRRLRVEEELDVSLAIVAALGAIAEPSCLPELLELIADPHRSERLRIALLREVPSLATQPENLDVAKLLDTLCDPNRFVALTALHTLVELLGDQACDEVVRYGLEVAVPADLSRVADALRVARPDRAVALLRAVQDPNKQDRARSLLEHLGGRLAVDALVAQRQVALGRSSERVQEFDSQALKLFQETISEAKRGFSISLFMSVTIFAVGLILLGVSVNMLVAGASGAQLFAPGVTGISGLATILAMFYRGPLERVQQAVANLVQVEIAFLGYIRQVTQIAAMFEREYLDDNTDFGITELEMMLAATHRSMCETMPLVREFATPLTKPDHPAPPT